MKSKKVLIGITSYYGKFYADGKKTGLFIAPAIQAYKIYRRKGYEVDFTSEDGTYGIDEYSLSYENLKGEDLIIYACENSDFNEKLKKLKRADEIDSREYEIFYATSGYGCLFDYPHSKLSELASEIYNQGGIVAAICHAQIMFDGLKNKETGKFLIEGKVITGFPEIGEKLNLVYDTLVQENLPTIPTIAKRNGAKYLSPVGPFDDFSIADGRIITGVNAASAASTALRTLTVIKEIRSKLTPEKKGHQI
ncbi:glutathione-independent glyoxalase Hsp31p [[Candida] railenensis]|uniref:D-lactate dehydratase n=1 Tax=[Candida] railenensis TaxID=45579 RepID=A0A9P0W166_9ASCO|nr:glutathione-independent glyoxalase Hsp31p [[Candida] railenensis]